jgi:hypothetical protein
VIAVQMRRAYKRVHQTSHGSGGGFPMVVELFSLDSVGIQVVHRGEANARAGGSVHVMWLGMEEKSRRAVED